MASYRRQWLYDPEGLLFVLGRQGINIYPDKTVYPLTIENKVLTYPGIKEAVIVSGVDKEHSGYEVPYLFIVLETEQNTDELIKGSKENITNEFAPEEQPKEIFVIGKKPISHFKTDRKSLQKEYNLI